MIGSSCHSGRVVVVVVTVALVLEVAGLVINLQSCFDGS